MTEPTVYTAREVAARLRCSYRKVLHLATSNGIGSNFQGSAGFRFTEQDIADLLAAARPAPKSTTPRRRRRAA